MNLHPFLPDCKKSWMKQLIQYDVPIATKGIVGPNFQDPFMQLDIVQSVRFTTQLVRCVLSFLFVILNIFKINFTILMSLESTVYFASFQLGYQFYNFFLIEFTHA